MDRRSPVWIALASNIVVASTTFALRGWNAGSAHAAARNTARFSALWFVVAFAAPGLLQWVRRLPSGIRLLQSFFAAHAVHFFTVALLLWSFERAHVTDHPARAAGKFLGGFGLVVVAVVTATPRLSRLYAAIHAIALYAVFAIFFVAFGRNPVVPLRVIALLLGVALILRIGSGWRVGSSYRVKTAE
jgi:hypothetical protein